MFRGSHTQHLLRSNLKHPLINYLLEKFHPYVTQMSAILASGYAGPTTQLSVKQKLSHLSAHTYTLLEVYLCLGTGNILF